MNRPARIPSGMAFTGFTAGEFQRMVDSGAFADLRVELVGGEIVKIMPSYLAHGEANMKLGAKLLAAYAGIAHVAVDVMIATAPDTIRAADIAVVRSGAPRTGPIDPQDLILVVEIAGTTLAEDLGAKLTDYLEAGIGHYWVVDLEGRIVQAMTGVAPEGYRDRRVFRFGEALAIPGANAEIVVD